MLRLKASEITLTPADVEETRRRMERRQAANPHSALPVRIHGPRVPPLFGPRVRRGPERSRDDAIATLGDIPILRPHQVIHGSIYDADDAPPHAEVSSEDGESVSDDASTHSLAGDQMPNATSTRLHILLPSGDLQLPFRPAPSEREGGDRSMPRGTFSEDLPSSPPKQLFRYSRFGQERTNPSEDGNEGPSQARTHAATDGHVEDPDTTYATPTGDRVRSLRQHSSFNPSPLQQMLTISSPRQRGGSGDPESNGAEDGPLRYTDSFNLQERGESPTRYLWGYFDQRRQIYTFIERMPQTEPRPRSQPTDRARTMSSSSDPTHSIQVQRPDHSGTSEEDVFWTPSAPEPPLRTANGVYSTAGSSNDRYWSTLSIDGTGRLNTGRQMSQRLSSEASIFSSAYSFYELPESRRSSDSRSQGALLGQSQYDGAGPSRPVSGGGGAYHSIRLGHNRPAGGTLQQPPPSRVRSQSSAAHPHLGQHGVSPLPARPYGRAPSTQQTLRLSTGLVTQNDLVGGDQAAARAAQRDLSSPLDLLQERATSYFDRIAAGIEAGPIQTNLAVPPVFQHQVTDIDASQTRQRTQGWQAIAQPRPLPEQPRWINAPQIQRRGAPIARIGQRSSENMPVSTSSQEGRADRTTQGQSQRMALRSRPNPPSSGASMRGGDVQMHLIPIRFGIPQATRPRDVSNRPHMHSPHPLLVSDDDSSGPDTLTLDQPSGRVLHNFSLGSFSGPQIPPRNTSRQQDFNAPVRLPHRQQARRLITSTPAPYHVTQHGLDPPPLPFNRPPSRGPPSTSTTLDVASGVTSRRPMMNRAPMSRRRIPRQQVNQENSDNAVRGAVMEERAALGMRYGGSEEAGGRGEVMDETPPRIGRFERYMG